MSEKNLKVAVVAANGRVGQLVVEETMRRGMDVTAVVRGENRTAAEKALVKDALELTAADLAGFDAVVDAAGGWTPETIPAITNVAIHLADCVAGNTPVIIKFPFWRMAAENPHATYACVNLGETMAPVEIAERSVLLDRGAAELIEALRKR